MRWRNVLVRCINRNEIEAGRASYEQVADFVRAAADDRQLLRLHPNSRDTRERLRARHLARQDQTPASIRLG